MPVKSHSNTKKKKTGSKSSAVTRSNKMSRKAGTNCGGATTKSPKKSSPSPSPKKSSPSPEKPIEMPEDLPLPKIYTKAQKKKDIDVVNTQLKKFYDNSDTIKRLKQMNTNTKEERFAKKQFLAEGPTSRIPILPQEIEAGIKDEITKQMQPKIKNWEKTGILKSILSFKI